MQKLILYLFAFVSFSGAKSQPSKEQLEQAKFNIIKKTVEFLSTDKATFKNVKTNTCENCTTIDALRNFAADNDLKKAATVVIDPLSNEIIDLSTDKWERSLLNFKNIAINKITRSGKEYRKSLPGFKEYEASLDTIVEGVGAENMPGEENVAAKTKTDNIQVKQLADTSGNERTVVQGKSLLPVFFSLLPYCIAALLLGLLVYMISKNNKIKQRKEHYKEEAKQLKRETEQYKKTILTLTTQNKELEQKLSDSELDRIALEDRLKLLEEKKTQPVADQKTEAPVRAEKRYKKPSSQPPKPPLANIKYARYADMGDGFSNAELLEKPDNETIFELTIASNNIGEYKIINNPDAQKYALSNAQYFLGKTCQYDTFPLENANIQTDAPGAVKLNGGKWIITNPAKISFI